LAGTHAQDFMNSTPDQIKIFLSMLSTQLPTMIVCLVACVLILTRWTEGSRGLLWALLGFGSVLALCLVLPVVHTLIQCWVVQNSGQLAGRMWVFTAVSVVSSFLHAATYVLLLIAVLAGHPAPKTVNLPPFTPQR